VPCTEEYAETARYFASVDARLNNRKYAAKGVDHTKNKLKAQDELISGLVKQLEEAREQRSVLLTQYNFTKAHDRSNVQKEKGMRSNSLKSLKVNLKQTVQEVKFAHLDGYCDGTKYNHQKCSRLSVGWKIIGVNRRDYCAEHQDEIRYNIKPQRQD
jgi:hypothetical protein